MTIPRHHHTLPKDKSCAEVFKIFSKQIPLIERVHYSEYPSCSEHKQWDLKSSLTLQLLLYWTEHITRLYMILLALYPRWIFKRKVWSALPFHCLGRVSIHSVVWMTSHSLGLWLISIMNKCSFYMLGLSRFLSPHYQTKVKYEKK